MISTNYKTYFFKNTTVINGSIFKMMKDKTMRESDDEEDFVDLHTTRCTNNLSEIAFQMHHHVQDTQKTIVKQ